jgi:hypothetical protein
MSEQDYLGHQACQQLEEEKIRTQDPLGYEFGELKYDLTGSSNSKSFSVEKIQELIRDNATITVIQPTSSYNSATRLDPPILSCSNTV